MLDWLSNLWEGATGAVGDLIERIKRAVGAVWSFIRLIFGHVDDAWDYMVRGAKSLGGALWDFAGDVYNAIKVVITEHIPRAVRFVLRAAHRTALGLFRTLRDWARAAIDVVRKVLVRAIKLLEGWARNAVRLLGRGLREAWHLLRFVAGKVRDLLGSAARLARWVFGPLWRLLVRYIDDHAAAWGAWVLRHLGRAMLWSLNLIESILARVI